MASRSIGTLTIDLIAKIGGFVQGLDKAARAADRRSKEIAATLGKIGTAAGAAAAAAGTAVAAWTKELTDLSAQVVRFSQLSGSTTDVFQSLAFGAKTVGIEQEKLADIFKDVQDKVGDFMQTGGGAMADFFENIAPKVGVTAEQFRKLSGPDALQLYVKSLEQAKLSQSDMVFYMEAIASDATALLPLLRDNGKEWQELAKQAKAFGVVIDSDVIQAAKALDKQIKDLQAIFQGFKTQLVSDFIPAAIALTGAIKDVAGETSGLGRAANDLRANTGFKAFAEDVGLQLAKVADYIAQSKREFLGLVDFAQTSYTAARQYLKLDIEGGRQTAKEFRERYGLNEWGVRVIEQDGKKAATTFEQAYRDQLATLRRSAFAATDPRRVDLKPAPTISAPPRASGGGRGRSSGGQATDPYAEAMRYIEGLRRQIEATENLTVVEQVLRDMQLGRIGKVTEGQKSEILGLAGQIDAARALEEQRKKDLEVLREQERAMQSMKDEGKALYEQMRTPLEVFNDRQERLNLLLKEGAIDLVTAARAGETYAKELKAALEPVDDFAKRAAQNIQDNIGSGLVDIMEGNYKNIGDGFVKMINRMVAEALAADLSRALFGDLLEGGKGTGLFGGLLKNIGGSVGGGKSGGGIFDALFGVLGGMFGGARANGGPTGPNKLYRVNERGPELFSVNGADFLMTGDQPGRVTPNHKLGGGGFVQNLTFNVAGQMDRRTVDQTANEARRRTQMAARLT